MRSANDGTGIGLAILVSFIALGTGHVFGTIVSTEDGALEGIVVPLQKGNIYQFKKIPYAMPPVGPLRFSKPLKHPPWNNTLNATDFGPACIQSGSLTHPVSEDCLFLNVYVPHQLSTTANKSVMFWIHGGGYRSGSGMEYDGTSLALQGDVIVVTLNYRLGVFGFFSTGDSSARGNYGLWDQIEALKWIKSNIKYFGGNSDSITLFGESAGAFSVFHLALFPGNQNLFHRVIMQSGTFGFVQKDPFTYAQALGDHLQCSDVHSTTSLVSCLREVEATTLLTGSHIAYMFSSLNDIFAMPLAPVIDGELISVDPLSLLRNESSEELAFYKSLDVISGCNSAEGSLLLMVIPLFPDLFLPAGNLSKGIPSWVLKLFAQSLTETKYNNDSRILQLVYDKYTSTDIAEQGRLIVNFFSDFTYYLPMLESLWLHNRGGNSHANSFQYFFSNAPLVDFALGVLPEWFEGAGHGTEINYLFDNWGYLSGNNRVLSTTMMSYWTNFANNGNPNMGLPVPYWSEFDETSRQYIDLGTEITTGSDLLGDRIRFWTDEIPRVMSETEIAINTPLGRIRGISQKVKGKNIYQFRKIPFAVPPIGLLRFAKPVSVSRWNDTLDATRFGPACIQTISAITGKFLPNKNLSEDCLFVNVYVPNELTITANKSVMVWIHGGGYRSGSGMEYDGTSLALQGDVIVVTLNYRLGVFGFFSTGDSSARGNYGLWDQIEALKWIKSNIKYFGGNSDSITLFGESAGAFSVFHLALFPGNQNLFHRVIMQSGTFGFVQKDPFTYAQALGDHLQCSDVHSTTSLVSCLREVEATTLLTGSHIAYMFSSLNDIFAMPLAPVIDGELISVDPLSLLRNESSEELAFYKSLDVISGCNSAEGSLLLMVIPLFPDLFLPAGNLSKGIPSWVLKLFAQSLTETKYNNDSRILQLVYDKYTSTDIAEQGRLIVNFFSDFTYYLPMLESLWLHNRGGNSHANSFQYFFSNAPLVDFALGVLPEWFEGAGHGTEINYLFDNWGYLSGNNRVLSTTMMSYWTNFANNGNPNMGLPVPYWSEFDETSRQYIDLGTEITTGSDLLGDRIRFWTDEIPRVMSETEIAINTPLGRIRGISQKVKGKNIYQFRKIPFAVPPIGLLRFAKPVSVSRWNDTLDATRFGPACIQTISAITGKFLPNKNLSEDCLFVNVYVPNELTITANKSVMVWIHGGGYRSGSGMEYDGTSLALQGDVIVVTLNYRLGVFGFFSTGDSSARGNYGLWDQIEALKWIKSNIKYFGGNSDSITLFGESAGAFSVFHLALFPGNQNLFHRVIMQSGTFGFVQKDPFTYAQALGDHLQCSDVHSTTSLVSCLREVEATTLLTGSHIAYMFSSLNDIFAMPLAPVIDGELISVDPLSLLRNESSEELAFYKSLDVISGCNSAEGSLLLMVIPLFPDLFLPAGNLSKGIPSWVLKLFAQSLTETKYNNDSRILQLVYDKYTSTDIAEQGRLIVNFFSDFTYYLPMLESLLLHNRGGNSHANSFQYFFSNAPLVDFALGVLPEWFEGAGHGTEINYLFDNWGYLSGNNRVLSTTMMSYWTNFANNGNPNEGLAVPYWPKFDEIGRHYIEMDSNVTAKSDLLEDRMMFWTNGILRILETNTVTTTLAPANDISNAFVKCPSFVSVCLCVILSLFYLP